MESFRNYCWVCLILFSPFSGCAVHAPVSETLMFHDSATRPTHDRSFGFGLIGTYSPTSQAVVEEAKKRDIAFWHPNPHRFGGGLYLSGYGPEGNFAASATIGVLVAGLDATWRVWQRNYLTAAYSTPGHVQAYFQHRAYNSPTVGATIGLGYRRDKYAFGESSECSLCLNSEYIDVNSIVTRGYVVYRGEGDTGGGIRLGLYAGYTPEIRRPIGGMTLIVGRF